MTLAKNKIDKLSRESVLRSKILLFLILCHYLSSSQTIERHGFISAGSVSVIPTLNIQSSIGELMVDTYAVGADMLTQGFVQSDQNIVTSFIDGNHCFIFNVFPNPALDKLNIDVFKNCSIEISIGVLDIYGTLHSVSMRSLKTESKVEYVLDISNLSAGLYFVKIYSGEKEFLETFKFLKL